MLVRSIWSIVVMMMSISLSLDLLSAEYPAEHAALLLPGVSAHRVQGVCLRHPGAPEHSKWR